MIAQLRRILRREVWAAEFASAVTALIWAAMTIYGWDLSFDWPSLDLLQGALGAHALELIAVGLGLAQLTCLMAEHRWGRWGVAAGMAWFWSALTLSMVVGAPGNPMAAGFAGWAWLNTYCVARLLRPGA